VAAWGYLRGGFVSVDVLVQSLHPLQLIVALGLMIFGQVLNAGIFKAIGHTGVYYGFKLGHKVPWVDGFPFNVVRHPQYVGSVATIWGAAMLAAGVVPLADVSLLVFYWTLLYIFTGIMES
jgi:phosphatidyl-N-methylethanolamine N-methyltransferase